VDNESIINTYRRYARVYDALFGPIFHPGRKLIVDALKCRPGERILEVGVGTGLSLPLYPPFVRVTGIDISAEMLRKASDRVVRQALNHVEAVLEMDAEDMRFPDNSFDKVAAMYVVSVVPNPERLVDEMRRVCKPGGDIFIVNHFRSENPFIGVPERLLSPFSKFAGFRPDLDLKTFLDATRLDVVEMNNANLFGYWKVLRCRNSAKEAMVA
jgi:phosphatidylethanolamine/phosphatidyl-N-methylethanolamine N-methyltransferase